ncbi:MAG: PIN domain-containing protein [Oscillochloris sp.]|nr:PIN domain-containing protein [Oscillochloris sp.]
MMVRPSVVLDTNVFVAAGFNRASHAARIIAAVRQGALVRIWNAATRDEIQSTLTRIPQRSWAEVADLFRPEGDFSGPSDPDHFTSVPDPADRVFAALAEATGATLVTNDAHLLAHQEQLSVPVLTPRAFWAAYQPDDSQRQDPEP